jgi:hypothetical protein
MDPTAVLALNSVWVVDVHNVEDVVRTKPGTGTTFSKDNHLCPMAAPQYQAHDRLQTSRDPVIWSPNNGVTWIDAYCLLLPTRCKIVKEDSRSGIAVVETSRSLAGVQYMEYPVAKPGIQSGVH